MRTLITVAAVAFSPIAFAQTTMQPGAPPVAAPPASAPSPTPPAASPPPASAPGASAAPLTATPGTAGTPATSPPPPVAPPAPPAPPTDPTAIALLDTLQNVCIPSVEGGNLDKLAKANGYRKSGDNYVQNRRDYKFTLLAPGSNPTQCHVDLVHPVYPEAPAAALVVALHNWSAVERNWTLYRNDKNVEGEQQLTTRSWEHDDTGKHEAMFITTYRHADGSPMNRNADTSTMVYSETPSS
jgi:hypothetical protein